jgi:hypothetical protein
VVFLGQPGPRAFFSQFGDGGLLVPEAGFEGGTVLLLLDDDANSFFVGPALAFYFIEAQFLLETGFFLLAALFLIGFLLSLLLLLQLLQLLLGQFGRRLRGHFK